MNHLFHNDFNQPSISTAPFNNSNNGSNDTSNGQAHSQHHQQQQQQQQQQQHRHSQQQTVSYPFQTQQHQQQTYQGQLVTTSSDNYRQFISETSASSTTYTSSQQSTMNQYTSQERPTQAHQRGISSEHSQSFQFNPSNPSNLNKNYSAESSGHGTFLSRPRAPGLPCIACNMAKESCDGGSPCYSCFNRKVRCHYEGDNNTRFFGIEALQLNLPPFAAHQQQQQRQQQNVNNHPDSHYSSQVASAESPISLKHARSRAKSDSGSASGSGSGSSTGNRNSQDHTLARVSPLISSPIQLSDQSLISIPPFQELTHANRTQHVKVTLPSIASMGSSIMPLSTTSSSSLSLQSLRSSSSIRPMESSLSSRAAQPQHEGRGIQDFGSTSNIASERPILPLRSTSDPRFQSLLVDRSNSPISLPDGENIVKRPSTKKQTPLPIHSSKDPLYSLSTASIRARKNALETENIQRASHLYADYVAKIRALSLPATEDPTTVNKSTSLSPPDSNHANAALEGMDVEIDEAQSSLQGAHSAVASTSAAFESQDQVKGNGMILSATGAYSEDGLQALQRLGKTGMLHSLVQQYFTLIHPQFMILHKNRFLIHFWAEYGPYPEAKELHIQLLQAVPRDNVWRGSVEAPLGSRGAKENGSNGTMNSNPLLLMAMLALISRHIDDRGPLKSTVAEKQRRIARSLELVSDDYRTTEQVNRCKEKVQVAHLEELMETDMDGHNVRGENLKDRGEQYFQWASELLKAEYEQPSLVVVQSLLLLREYAVMAGNHRQAYMYGGTAITMAMQLGWHHTHPVRTPNCEEDPNIPVPAQGSAEAKAVQDRQKENKAKDEEQKMCWWHCFIIDRWMSAAYNRPVNIPVHIFDKTHLRPLPKPQKMSQLKSADSAQSATSVLTSDIWLSNGGQDDSAIASSLKQSGGVNILPYGAGVQPSSSINLPGAQVRAKAFFDQQCRQALLLNDIIGFLSSLTEDLFVSSTEFEKLSEALDDWYHNLAEWQTFPLLGIMNSGHGRHQGQRQQPLTHGNRELIGTTKALTSTTHEDEGRDVVQCALLGISFHTIRILLFRPFLRTNLRHPPCQPARASAICAQSANAMTALAESLMNQMDPTIQPCLLMRHQFSLVTAAGIQLMNSNLEDEPRLSTPAKINLLKTIRLLRDADRSSWGVGVQDGIHELLRDLFPAQTRQMYESSGPAIAS
ncbi:hypothetical protein BGZ51_008671 [Haplosporangium sp. Z 767]|nr:hypothetical protein BGZ50_009359 [Haplosporangium sp. Z 11]KAF9190378.1 hypothetical protein BGZ51_008671 [Haplosporangium sp. Z 767]